MIQARRRGKEGRRRYVWAGEMAVWMEHLLGKYGGQSSNPKHQGKKLGGCGSCLKSRALEVGGGDPEAS